MKIIRHEDDINFQIDDDGDGFSMAVVIRHI